MTTNFTNLLRSGIVWISFAAAATAADSIILQNGNTLSGKLIDSEASGVMTLSHPDAKQPIRLKESSVERIIFDTSNSQNSHLTESIKLINGDNFPCTITDINDKIVSFESQSLGSHTINRNKVSQIKFNTKANKALYSGPGEDLSAWTTTTEDWKLKNGKLSVNKRSDAAIQIPNLTENYILEFKTAWEHASPHIRVCFSSSNRIADRKSDYYYVDLNSHGISLYRSNKGKYFTLTQVLRNDDIYGQSKLHVAIHVDRKNQKLALYFNGKLTKTISDSKASPIGNYLIVKNLQRTGVSSEISDIKISSWGGKVAEDIESKADTLAKHDIITDLSGSIMTGKILKLSRDAEKISLYFKAPFAKNDSQIQGKAIDLLEFKVPSELPNHDESIYHLNLVSGGIISYFSSQMIDGKLNVEHPFLGSISLPKSSLASVLKIPNEAKKKN